MDIIFVQQLFRSFKISSGTDTNVALNFRKVYFLKLGLIFVATEPKSNQNTFKLLITNLYSVGCASLCSSSEVMLTSIVLSTLIEQEKSEDDQE
jgi:hypothetical protein